MIIFYNKTNGEVLGTVEGRIHDDSHLKMSISTDSIDPKDVGRVIIGAHEIPFEDGLPEDDPNKLTARLKGHNMHLFELLKEFEDPRNPKTPLNHKVVVEKGKSVSLLPVN